MRGWNYSVCCIVVSSSQYSHPQTQLQPTDCGALLLPRIQQLAGPIYAESSLIYPEECEEGGGGGAHHKHAVAVEDGTDHRIYKWDMN